MLTGVNNIVDTNWYYRNQAHFHSKIVNVRFTVNRICVGVNIIGNFS
jgi:hypothetical protein